MCWPSCAPQPSSLKQFLYIWLKLKFCTTFGLPKEIQTDQGSNFTSKKFKQILTEMGVLNHMSSAYHPKSQGAFEQYHQTLKVMIHVYSVETGREWDEGLPFLPFATCESVQESTGFSPADLVFGYTIRGPMKMLIGQLLSERRSPVPVSEYDSSFKEHLHRAWDVVKRHLSANRVKMNHVLTKRVLTISSTLVTLSFRVLCLQQSFQAHIRDICDCHPWPAKM